jgi:hypothetical protein
MTTSEREALLLLVGWVARLEGGLAKQDGITSPLATRLEQLIRGIEAGAETNAPGDSS